MEKMMKRLLSFAVALVMVLGMVPASVFATETDVAVISGTGYESLSAALADAKTMSGDVTVEIYGKVTLAESLSGSYDTIKFVGKDTDAEIYLDIQGYITATGKKVVFEDLILSKAEGGYITNAGFMNVAFGVYDVVEVTYTGCTFANGAYAASSAVTYTDCTFYRSFDKYGLWAYGDVDVVVDGCTFADYRGIKMYAEGAQKTVNLTVKNTDFSAVNNKPAIVLTYGESVTLENNTYSSTGVFELDLDGAPDGTAVTSDVYPTCTNDNGDTGVLVDGKIYTTAAKAAEVAVAGSTVVLLHDSQETVEFAEGVILNKNGFTAAGVTVKESAAPALPTATVTMLDAESLGLTFAMNFLADEATDEQLEYYGTWPADYVLSTNKDIVFNANGTADGWLSGQYDGFGSNWVNVPDGDVTLKAGEPIRVMEYAMELMGYETALTYNDIYTLVQDFNCGLYLDDEFLAANPDLEVTLELRMYNPENSEESYAIGESYTFEAPVVEAPELPTATVTEIENDRLTFAMNFKADEATEAQLAYYGGWYADYVLTVNKDVTFNADGGADGFLSGQYDEWSENWVDVPYGKGNVTLNAGEELQIMKYAAELMGKTGLRYTYSEVYERVQDFDCGVFFEEEFLAANPDLEVTLELRIYNPADETENYKIGDTYLFYLGTPELPTATATEIENDDLTFAMNFKADKATAAQLDYYGPWYADYVLTINKDVTFNADGGADGWLSGQYDAWSENWVNVPYGKGNVTLKAGEGLQIMKFAAELMGKTGLRYTYQEVYDRVKDFDCGVFFTEEFLAANPDLEVTLELRIYNPADETENYKIGETYVFTLSDFVAENVNTGVQYSTVAAALEASQEGETVRLLKDVTGEKAEEMILILNDRTLDLNGFTLEATDVIAVTGGAKIQDSSNGAGLLKVAKSHLTLPYNDQLPYWIENDGGFRFVTVQFGIQQGSKTTEELVLYYWFEGALDRADLRAELENVENHGLSVYLRVSYKMIDGQMAELDIRVPNTKLATYATWVGAPAFQTTIKGLENVSEVTITPYVAYETVEICTDAVYDYSNATE